MKQLISFTVGTVEYGLDLLRVKEVIRMRQVTWLPKAPACVKGIINLMKYSRIMPSARHERSPENQELAIQ